MLFVGERKICANNGNISIKRINLLLNVLLWISIRGTGLCGLHWKSMINLPTVAAIVCKDCIMKQSCNHNIFLQIGNGFLTTYNFTKFCNRKFEISFTTCLYLYKNCDIYWKLYSNNKIPELISLFTWLWMLVMVNL